MIRKFKIKLVSVLVVALAALTGCDGAYPGVVYDNGWENTQVDNTEGMEHTPIMVFINEQNFFSVSATRGSGALGDETVDGGYASYGERLENSNIYVYAFRATTDAQGELQSAPDLTKTLAQEEAGKDIGDYKDCLIDATRSGAGNLYGLKTHLGENSSSLLQSSENADEKYYYSARYQDTGYDFFAYHIDRKEPLEGLVREQARIYYKDFSIDGSEDILCGYAPRLTKKLIDSKNEKLAEAEKDRILNIDGYSTYAAHRDIHPTIDLNHVLTRLKFKVRAASKELAGNKNIVLREIQVACKNRGDLVVAARRERDENGIMKDPVVGFFPYGTEEFLPLRDKPTQPGQDGSNLFETVVRWEGGPNDKQTSIPVGESLMLPPAQAYELKLVYSHFVPETAGSNKLTEYQLTAVYKMKAPADPGFKNEAKGENYYEFKAGCVHEVDIAVFGLEHIEINAAMQPWVDGGSTTVDPDDPNDPDAGLEEPDIDITG